MLESLFNKVAVILVYCKIYLLRALLRFYFSLAKILKNSLTFYKLCSFKKC